MGLTPSRLSVRSARLSARLGRWPRRIAALACLLLAAGSALTPAPSDAAHRSSGVAARLRPGQVAVPVPVSSSAGSLAQVGQRIGLVAPHGLVADRLRVLSLHPPDQSLAGDDSAVVVVAASPAQAVRLAGVASDRLVLIVDELP